MNRDLLGIVSVQWVKERERDEVKKLGVNRAPANRHLMEV